MFSGIVEDVGTISETKDSSEGRWMKITTSKPLEDPVMGESISVSGTCLTVVDFGSDWFAVEAVHETLRRTKLGSLSKGDKVNLERALRLSDRLGGHLVSGHIDAVGKVVNIQPDGFSKVFTFAMDKQWAPYFVEKGSVAIDGVSLTVVDVDVAKKGEEANFLFTVALIPHTLSVTTLGALTIESPVNIETDIVARYVARWLGPAAVGLNNVNESMSAALEHG